MRSTAQNGSSCVIHPMRTNAADAAGALPYACVLRSRGHPAYGDCRA